MELIKMVNHKHIIIGQLVFLIIIVCALYIFYPRTDYTITGDVVRFNSGNSHVIIFSQNSDFSNPKYVNVNEAGYLKLSPGTYYWKPANSFITGFSKSLTIDSEVVLEIETYDDEIALKNRGNVKVNITKNDKGVLTGHIILEPDESEILIDSGDYTGRQE